MQPINGWIVTITIPRFFGETNQSYTATVNGNYAVEITQDGCTSLSECISITTVGVNDFEYETNINVYPNPSSGIFNIEFDNVIDDAVLTIMDINGRLISNTQIQNAMKASVEINEAPGIYLLTIQTEEWQKTIQLIKE